MTKPTATTTSLSTRRPAIPQFASRLRPASPSPFRPDRSAGRLRFEFAVKCFVDRALAVLLLALSLPIVVIGLLAMKLSSRGPSLYSQKRVGQFGRVFTIWKIRTMYHNCEKLTGPRWSTPGDPRVTLVGHVLRAMHIDELPQLINVLRGQMSLIGPRPERPEIACKLKGLVEEYDSRHAVLPGITGNAQIHLPPDTNINSVRDKLVLDRTYIGRFSMWQDVVLLALTGLKMIGLYSRKKK
jgi:lipopolysaccharide/colanic/teichoic acid biosynthesis glycosyltransferase